MSLHQDAPRNTRKPYTVFMRRKILAALETQPVAHVAQQVGRSPKGIYWLARRCGVYLRSERTRHAGMSLADIAVAFDVDASQCRAWALSGGLRATTFTGNRRRQWSVNPDDLLDWLRVGNCYRSGIHPVDPIWREEVAQIRAELGWMTTKDIAVLIGTQRKHVVYLHRCHAFPAPRWSAKKTDARYAPADVAAWLRAHPQYQTSAARRWLETQP